MVLTSSTAPDRTAPAGQQPPPSTPSSGSRTCCTGCTPAAAPATRWLKASLRPGRGLDGPLGPAQGHPRSPPPPPRPPARRAAFFLPRGAPGHAHGSRGGLSGGRLGPALPPGIPRAPRTPLDFLDGPDPAPIPPAMRDLPTASFSSKAAGSRTRSKSRQLSRGRGREDGSHNHRGGVPKQLPTRPVRVVPSGVHPLRGAASCSPPSSPPARCRWRPGTRRPGSSAGRRPPRRRRRRCRSWSWRSGRS